MNGINETIDRRISWVAFEINRDLPAGYQQALVDEAKRVEDEILRPRGLERRRVLIVGGAGYIGAVVTDHLLQCGYPVRCLDRLLYENGPVVLPWIGREDYSFDYGDLSDPAAVAPLLDDVTDVVILGSLVGDPITRKYPDISRAINLDGTLALLDVLGGRGINRVIFVSTCSNYGLIPEDVVADENYALKPLSIYAETKVAVERELLARRDAVDYGATVLRFATAFGISPRMRFDLTVSEFVRELYLGRELLVYDPDTWRPYCDVHDFAEVIRRVLEAPQEIVSFEVLNAGGDINNYTKRMIVDEIVKILPDARVRYQDQGSDPRNYRVDFTKIRERLHFEPRYTVPQGIRELVGMLDRHLFDTVDMRPNFHGNRVISYP